MDFAKVAKIIAEYEPTAAPHEIAQIAMIFLRNADFGQITEEAELTREQISSVKLRLKAACDQHAAMAEEVQSLACSDPRKYSPDQVWTLVRAIKVQSQMLELYAGDAACSIG